jgi:ketosteroid isomerase-like protein
MSNDESQIRQVIEAHAATLRTGDVKALLAHYAPQVVEYSLAPPLRQRTDRQDPEPLERWLATFEAPPQRTVTELDIAASGDVAYATSLDCLTATPKGKSESFNLWYRSTLGLRKIDGRWLIAHEHHSVPFEMDGSFRASTNLTP